MSSITNRSGSGTSTVATPSVAGIVSTTAQSFGGLKKGEGGFASVEYVGTNPEVGGSSPFQLTNAHHRTQIVNPAGDITVKLPTTTVLAGEIWKIVNRSTFVVTIQSSDGTQLAQITKGVAEFTCLTNTPTASTDWLAGNIITDWILTDLTISGAANPASGSQKFLYTKRVRDTLHCYGLFYTTTLNSNNCYIQLPSGLTIDTNKCVDSSVGVPLGTYWRNGSGSPQYFGAASAIGVCFASSPGTNTNKVYMTVDGGSSMFVVFTGSAMYNNNQWNHVKFEVPIAQWA